MSRLDSNRRIKILHVDDDPCVLESTKNILLLDGNFEIDCAVNVQDAFNKIANNRYDVVISDYEMPGKNGLQFLKELREQENFVPFILFTGKEGVEIATEALDLGVEYHVDKHGSLEIVFEKLMHYIRMAVENSGTNL